VGPGDGVELRVVDLSLARTFFEGTPAAHLLARVRLASDERDLAESALRRSATSSWDALLARLLGASAAASERVKRAVAKHARAAFDDGPLALDEAGTAALVLTVAVSTDGDASPTEAFGAAHPDAEPGTSPRGEIDEPTVVRACAAFEPRAASGADLRAVLFEACVRSTTRAVAGPWPAERVRAAFQELAASELGLPLRASSAALFPLAWSAEVAPADRRMALLERAGLDSLVAKDPRELASALVRSGLHAGTAVAPRPGSHDADGDARAPDSHADTLLANLTTLLSHRGELVLSLRGPDPEGDDAPAPSIRPSWMPADWTSPEASSALADAVERGGTTLPRLRGLVARGGEPALDAIGAEMLRVAAHPFASAAFAEILARSGRPRDVMRLVTYFAVAPDPAPAARALAACAAPELPSVLRAWLEAMLPQDGGFAPPGENPETSSAARLTACVASLAPYPRLFGAVRTLMSRVSEAPPPNSSDGPSAPP
jgi:hypothetical protein